jgi:hypothetical protein
MDVSGGSDDDRLADLPSACRSARSHTVFLSLQNKSMQLVFSSPPGPTGLLLARLIRFHFRHASSDKGSLAMV